MRDGDAGSSSEAVARRDPGSSSEAVADRDRRETASGIELKPVYRPDDVTGRGGGGDLGRPGEIPFTRGIHPSMYRGRLWTMRQYAGMATAAETNRRFRYLLEHGQTGLSVAFDLPTQMGLDSDHSRAEGEVGKTGVAIDSVEDMHRLLAEIPLDRVSTSMTINATAPILLLMYELVAEERGIDAAELSGTVQNDLLKEYAARGTYIYPPKPSMRLITDLFAYCGERIPRWNTISISGYHMREAGATAVQEVAFTLANGIAYVQAALDAGLAVDEFAPRLSFFFACHMDFFEEVAKFRAARRMWARIMAERFGAKDPKSLMLRFHTQTGGATLTAQQPENNVVRTALEALAAVLGGTQSLHTNSFDEAFALPTEEGAKVALRTQQIIGLETGVSSVADPFGGAYFVEALTDEIEERARRYVDEIDGMGGAVAAIETGFYQDEIHESAFGIQKGIESGERVVVGVNRFRDSDERAVELQRIGEEEVATQVRRLHRLRADRDRDATSRALEAVDAAARGTDNLLSPMKEALRARATLGEVSEVLRTVFGEYHPNR
ncbi:MAG: acyl-CoA mutase large subunit family protein [Actinomycetota bacterium]